MTGIKKWVSAILVVYAGNVIGVIICSCLWPDRAADSLWRLAAYSGITAVFLLITGIIYLIMRWDER